jgi:tRNA pseudouridine55 synthase
VTKPPEGLLLVDKPSGLTSHDVVDAVRRVFGTRKVGHAGTLDPLATGLLVVGMGRATRLLRFLSGLDKTYEGTARLGEETDTLDADGRVVRTAATEHVTEGKLREAMAGLVGESEQIPPAYSAVKVGGRTLHRAARGGDDLAAEPRLINVDAFDLLSFDGRDFDFVVTCSSGTYVRALVSDVGTMLHSAAHLRRLIRTRVGPFTLKEARPLDRLGEALPIERAVAHLPSISLGDDEARAAGNGRPLGPAGILGPYAVVGPDGRLVAVYRDEHAKAVPEMVLAPAEADVTSTRAPGPSPGSRTPGSRPPTGLHQGSPSRR